MPRLSVLMPVYDGATWVAQAVDSILSQTFGDFELLAIDDGSQDATPQILAERARRDPRVRVVRRDHEGLIGALNAGLALARGDLVARMDADDLSLPDRLRLQVERLDRDEKLVCVGGAFELVDAGNRLIKRNHPPCEHREIVARALAGRSAISHSAATYRRDAVRSLCGYDPAAELVEDLDLWLRLAEIGRLANLPDVVSQVRVHPGSLSVSAQERQQAQRERVCARARERRGLAPQAVTAPPRRPARDRRSRQRFAVDCARAAWWQGERRTAALYVLRAASLGPWQAPMRELAGRALRRLRRGAGRVS